MTTPFRLESHFAPAGDQALAIKQLVGGLQQGVRDQILLGVTGSGKTYTMANVVASLNRPTLVIAPNKTLAAQLFLEFREFFPDNAVEYFVSYYDYYQPEAYMPRTDTFIEKDATLNERLDRLRHSATRSLLEREDVLIVASVSCIYGLGSPEAYQAMSCQLRRDQEIGRDDVLRKLATILYTRNDIDFRRGTFRVRGDVVDIIPAYEDAFALRVEFWGDTIEGLSKIDWLTGEVLEELCEVTVFPRSHYVTPDDMRQRALVTIEAELEQRLIELRQFGKVVEAARIEQRTLYDLAMLREVGSCAGVENYSRHLTGREEGQAPPTLIDYFPDNALFIIDESHVTVPQIRGMYHGDHSRKRTLVDYGFRLPSALDNRPLRFEEFDALPAPRVYVSATPGDYELALVPAANIAEQFVRPTGLLDPPIEVRPTANQVHDLMDQIKACADLGQRVLVTTLTKRMSEHLAEFYLDEGLRVKYLHSDIDTLERAQIIRALREGLFDCLIGINLLREGLDLPEVALVAILDADKPGFLRSERALIQTCGRAARHVEGRVILYADGESVAMRKTLAETKRRRKKQKAYNKKHSIMPKSVSKSIGIDLNEIIERAAGDLRGKGRGEGAAALPKEDLDKRIASLRAEMMVAARALDYELAAELRNQLFALEELGLSSS